MIRSFRVLLPILAAFLLVVVSASPVLASSKSSRQSQDEELQGAFRNLPKNGWTFVHLQGTPHQIGFQNGYLLAPEIQDTLNVIMLEARHDNHKDWQFFRDAAQNMMCHTSSRNTAMNCRA